MAIAPTIGVPSIALLLVGGVLLGPEVLGLINPASLGSGLSAIVQLAVAVVLFEGGLTLDIKGYKRAPAVIVRMLTVGVLVTWLSAALALWAIAGVSPSIALLGGSLVIVTGPTVISPLLRRLGVSERLYHVLYWEAVLVDAVGVFIAILCLEWATLPAGSSDIYQPIGRLAVRIAVGGGLGFLCGFGLTRILDKDWVGEQVNILVLTTAVLLYAVCDAIAHEAGILGVIVAGFTVALSKPANLKKLKRFKLDLTELSIAVLFILLSANLKLDSFVALGPTLFWLVLVVIFVARPLNILICTRGTDLSVRERLFMSWVAPRGIVAASMASLVAVAVGAQNPADAALLEAFVFAVIAVTVIVQGISAPWLVRALKLEKEKPRLWVLLGDEDVTVPLSNALAEAGAAAAIVVRDEALLVGPLAPEVVIVEGDPLDPDLRQSPLLHGVGGVLAMHYNNNVNRLICDAWGRTVGTDAAISWTGSDWRHMGSPDEVARGLRSGTLRFDLFGPTEGIPAAGDVALMSVAGGYASPIRPGAELVPEATQLVLTHPIAALRGLFRRSVVISSGRPTFEETASQLLASLGAELEGPAREAVLAGILAREESMSTAFGGGVAIPHAYSSAVTQSIALVALVSEGVDCPTPDQEPVRVMFLVISPPDHADEHLRALSVVAQVGADNEFVARLTGLTDPDMVLAKIRARE